MSDKLYMFRIIWKYAWPDSFFIGSDIRDALIRAGYKIDMLKAIKTFERLRK